MVLKWWSVGSIVVLGLVWFVLAEESTAAARPLNVRVPVQAIAAPVGAPAMAQSAPPLAGTPAQPGAAPAVSVPGKPGDSQAQPVAAPAGNTGDAAPVVAAPIAELIAASAAQRQAGDLAGAEATLRQAMQKATRAADAARAGLFLAPLTKDALERRHLISAALLEDVVVGSEYDDAGRQLRELNQNPSPSLQPALKLDSYSVVANDSLWKLCNKVFPAKFHQSPEVGLVRIVNGLHADALRVGQVLKVPTEPLRIQVSMGHHGLTAFVGDTAIATYWIGLGKENRTPRDTFVIQVKQEDPAWFNGTRTLPFGDPENVLGTRWMGFEPKEGAHGFGIHGTSYPDSIGKDESMGCVRMRNAEVEELFEYVPRGTRVTIG
jgi:L,D-transpeptidase catalytic domain/LysM domain